MVSPHCISLQTLRNTVYLMEQISQFKAYIMKTIRDVAKVVSFFLLLLLLLYNDILTLLSFNKKLTKMPIPTEEKVRTPYALIAGIAPFG